MLSDRRSILAKILASAVIAFTVPTASASSWEIHDVDIPKQSPVVLKFKAFDPVHAPIQESWLINSVIAALNAETRWPLKSDNSSIADLSGLRCRVDEGRAMVLFQYVHVDHNLESEEWGQTLTFPVAYQIEHTDDYIQIQLVPPERAALATRKSPIPFFSAPKLWPTDKVVSDFATVMSAASSLRLRHDARVKGEENSSFRLESCVANFERLLGYFRFGSGTREGVFAYRTGQLRVPLTIAAVPYRDGTKILYDAPLPFELRPDGTGDGYELPANLAADIHRILSD